MSVNKVQLIGHLGDLPKVSHSENGTCIASFSIATTEKWKDKEGNKQEKTEWHRCVAFRKMAEVIEKYLQKGSFVYVEGKLRHRTYIQDGINKYISEVYIEQLDMLGSVKKQSEQPGPPTTEINASNQDDDLPF